jgi:hypothetical protein
MGLSGINLSQTYPTSLPAVEPIRRAARTGENCPKNLFTANVSGRVGTIQDSVTLSNNAQSTTMTAVPSDPVQTALSSSTGKASALVHSFQREVMRRAQDKNAALAAVPDATTANSQHLISAIEIPVEGTDNALDQIKPATVLTQTQSESDATRQKAVDDLSNPDATDQFALQTYMQVQQAGMDVGTISAYL